MERLRGETLSARLREKGRMSLPEAMQLLDDLTRGIGAAHAQGIVHRDLKPQNVFAHHSDGLIVWKILDFGVSKLLSEDGTLTHGRLVGTPSYMAPEQASGSEVDHRADLYSIVVVLYRALTGRPAFTGPSLPVLMRNVSDIMPPAPSHIAELPDDIDLVFAIGMAKRPDDRFDEARALHEAFRAAHEGSLGAQLRRRGERLVEAMPWAS
jgi:serine/threonine-protein kinase